MAFLEAGSLHSRPNRRLSTMLYGRAAAKALRFMDAIEPKDPDSIEPCGMWARAAYEHAYSRRSAHTSSTSGLAEDFNRVLTIPSCRLDYKRFNREGDP
jgi:hypothetical protein